MIWNSLNTTFSKYAIFFPPIPANTFRIHRAPHEHTTILHNTFSTRTRRIFVRNTLCDVVSNFGAKSETTTYRRFYFFFVRMRLFATVFLCDITREYDIHNNYDLSFFFLLIIHVFCILRVTRSRGTGERIDDPLDRTKRTPPCRRVEPSSLVTVKFSCHETHSVAEST